MSYEYWVVRYLPDAVRGEFTNVGVIAGGGSDWAVRRVSDLNRSSRLGGHLGETKAFFRRIELSIDSELSQLESLLDGRDRGIGRGTIEDLRSRMRNVVQLSAPRPILAGTAEEAAELAYELMVEDRPRVTHQRAGTVARQKLVEAFRADAQLSDHVRTQSLLQVGRQEAPIDMAIEDGVVRQLNHVWDFSLKSLDQLDLKVQAWSFLIGQVRAGDVQLVPRNSGRNLVQGLMVPTDVVINAVFTRPLTEIAHDHLDIAKDAWARLDVAALAADEAGTIVAQARELVPA